MVNEIFVFVKKLVSNSTYLIQVLAATAIVLANYTVGPFLSDEAILAIGLGLAIPEVLWGLILGVAQKIRKEE